MNGVGKKTLWRPSAAIAASVLIAACAGGSATITGTLVGADGHCLYVEAATPKGSDRYWLRHVPPDYVEGDDQQVGFVKPDGSVIRIGDPITVSGSMSWLPFETQCSAEHALDATAIY